MYTMRQRFSGNIVGQYCRASNAARERERRAGHPRATFSGQNCPTIWPRLATYSIFPAVATSHMTSLANQNSGRRARPRAKPVESVEHGPSSSDRVARMITNSILLGRCVPGQRFIEGDLARDLKVSRGTVREALKRLAAERVIELTPHRGAYVRVLTKDEALELVQVLSVLSGLAASLASARIKLGHNLKRLTAAYEQLRADGAKSDRILHSIDRSSFYDVIFEISGNRELCRIHPAAPTQILRMQVHPFLSAGDLEALFADYSLMYEAIARGDSKKARRAIEIHTQRRATQLERLPAEAFSTGWGHPE
jgi:DNA-binding GntR family transcriptional regulator